MKLLWIRIRERFQILIHLLFLFPYNLICKSVLQFCSLNAHPSIDRKSDSLVTIVTMHHQDVVSLCFGFLKLLLLISQSISWNSMTSVYLACQWNTGKINIFLKSCTKGDTLTLVPFSFDVNISCLFVSLIHYRALNSSCLPFTYKKDKFKWLLAKT